MTISTEGRSLGNFVAIWPCACGMNQTNTWVKLGSVTKILVVKFTLQIASPFRCNCTELTEGKGISTWKNMKNYLLVISLSLILVPLLFFFLFSIGALYSLLFRFTEIMVLASLSHVQPLAEILRINYKWQVQQGNIKS